MTNTCIAAKWLVGSRCKKRAVNADVTFAVKTAMIIRLNWIQMTENIRARTDFGALSPYLAKKKQKIRFYKTCDQFCVRVGVGEH